MSLARLLARLLALVLASLVLLMAGAATQAADRSIVAIAIHGGAGAMPRAQLTPERELAYRAALSDALDAGYRVLETQGTSLDAVTAAVRVLEDHPLFNAGRGAVLANDGAALLDASLMDGRTLRAGAVAGLRHVRNPIDLARLVMEQSPHVMLFGSGAEEFALQHGMALVPNTYFRTPARQEQLERVLRSATGPVNELSAFGTVGAVALDRAGNLAAATSTGGMVNKRWGRVGDSPIIGAGTYANNESCAVSSTGHGEFFIRAVVAHDICARVQYGGLSLERAARQVIHERVRELGGDGGVIAIDRRGNVVMDFSSEGMFRGMRDSRGRRSLSIYRD